MRLSRLAKPSILTAWRSALKSIEPFRLEKILKSIESNCKITASTGDGSQMY